jgi:dihydroxyacid dehydratase/phosphogluconate dehydratase
MTRGTSVLTVGENDKFVREGGMIGFVRTGDSIQIEVNLDSVNAGNLKISSRLLDLALIVHGKRG